MKLPTATGDGYWSKTFAELNQDNTNSATF
jgi:hypothetical protein